MIDCKFSNFQISKFVKILELESKNWDVPVVDLIALQENSPFKVLISTIISLRTKDEVTLKASLRLYKFLKKPKDVFNISSQQIEKAIYPCAFFKRKALQIKEICEILVNKYNSIIPDEIDELLKFNGVGRKTANLVLIQGYNKLGMCVDTHVHRISNRLGLVNTKMADDTEMVLREILEKKHWKTINSILVAFGQSTCRPIGPKCELCKITKYCDFFKSPDNKINKIKKTKK